MIYFFCFVFVLFNCNESTPMYSQYCFQLLLSIFFHPLTHVQQAFLENLDSKVLQYLSILKFLISVCFKMDLLFPCQKTFRSVLEMRQVFISCIGFLYLPFIYYLNGRHWNLLLFSLDFFLVQEITLKFYSKWVQSKSFPQIFSVKVPHRGYDQNT